MRKLLVNGASGLGLTAMVAGPAIAAVAQAIEQPAATSQTPPDGAAAAIDPAAVDALVLAMRQAIAALPADAPADDVEAAINFAFDQSGQPLGVLLAALDALEAGDASATLVAAVRSMRTLALSGRLSTGTGALASQSLNRDLSQSPNGSVLGGTDYGV
jgi:hypothetical protein